MKKTVAFVTNQFSCDRIIVTAREMADNTDTELVIIELLDSEFELNPEAVDHLFKSSKKNRATMRLIFAEDKYRTMSDIIASFDCMNILTGMPSSNDSIVYKLWKRHSEKDFFTVDTSGNLIEVATHAKSVKAV